MVLIVRYLGWGYLIKYFNHYLDLILINMTRLSYLSLHLIISNAYLKLVELMLLLSEPISMLIIT